MAHRNRWFTWVYLLKMVISHGYVSHNQMVTIPGMLTFNGGMVWHWLPGMMPWRLPGRWTAIAFRPAWFGSSASWVDPPGPPKLSSFQGSNSTWPGPWTITHVYSEMIWFWFIPSYLIFFNGHWAFSIESDEFPSASQLLPWPKVVRCPFHRGISRPFVFAVNRLGGMD